MSNASWQNKIIYYPAFLGNRKYYSVFIEKKKKRNQNKMKMTGAIRSFFEISLQKFIASNVVVEWKLIKGYRFCTKRYKEEVTVRYE